MTEKKQHRPIMGAFLLIFFSVVRHRLARLINIRALCTIEVKYENLLFQWFFKVYGLLQFIYAAYF